MKMPGHRSGFHICDILDLNNSNNEPKLAGLADIATSQSPITPTTNSSSTNNNEDTASPQLTVHNNNNNNVVTVHTPTGYPGASVRAPQNGSTPIGLQQLSDEALAAHQHHHNQLAAAAVSRHHHHHHPNSMMGASPYQLPANINHAMLTAEAAAGAYQSMFSGGKPWFHEQDHYGECFVVMFVMLSCNNCGVASSLLLLHF